MSSLRPFSVVPWPVILLFVMGLVLHVGHQTTLPVAPARLQDLPEPLPIPWLRVLSMAEPVVVAKILILWLQAFDTQAGVDLSLKDLDQARLEAWLEAILALDSQGQYPLLLAVRYYGGVAVPEIQRRFMAFGFRHFFADPRHRWPWLAHATIVAKHQLHDLPLALRYAQTLRTHTMDIPIPSWAKQMEMVILEEMGAWQRARSLIVDWLSDGSIHDPQEIHFLKERLHRIDHCLKEGCEGNRSLPPQGGVRKNLQKQ